MDTSGHPMTGMDAFAPAEIAALVRTRGVAKAKAGAIPAFVLGVLAGAFIGLGAVLATLVGTDSTLGFGLTRWLAGIAFSLGLILVVIAGAELFTGNNLMVMAVASRQVTAARLVRTWAIVYVGNFVGALSIVAMVMLAGWWTLDDKAVGSSALSIAAAKTALPFGTVFFRGILANALVCLAVWIATGGRSLTDKVVAIVPPVAAFVANGFEHSVANMYFIPMGLALKGDPGLAATTDTSSLTVEGFLRNLAASTLGNIVGGAILVGIVYWFVYLRPSDEVD
ncbi:MAG TPA: formate/nitrite transporter family protein [Actinomycetota bacterium]|jgi:formate/nitrite transporter|nr:formate/nitrite transporter family protein [Actinomycetota bacterium]